MWVFVRCFAVPSRLSAGWAFHISITNWDRCLLGTVPGIAQEGDTTLAWTVMFLILMFAHQKFFRGWPFQKR